MPDKPGRLSRRAFATSLAVAPVVLAQQQPAAAPNPNTNTQRQGTLPEVPPFQEPLAFTLKKGRAKAHPFPMSQVRLLASPFQDAADTNRAYMARLGEDRLLHNFRLNAGLPSNAKPFGGWEQIHAWSRGRIARPLYRSLSVGMRAFVRVYRRPADQSQGRFAGRRAREVPVEILSGGYLSAFPTEWFDRLDARKSVWAPFYTIHKIMAGMFDMYRHAGNKQALKCWKGCRMGGSMDCLEIRRAHAGHPQHRIRRHE